MLNEELNGQLWSRVFASDEARFESGSPGKVRVRRPRGPEYRYDPQYMQVELKNFIFLFLNYFERKIMI